MARAGDALFCRAADVLIKGEGFSDLASRQGNLVAVKARVELMAIDR